MQDSSKNNTDKLMKALGKIITKHRKLQKKTMYKISAEVSMSKSTWREAELGVCKDIKLTTLWKIAEGLDIPITKLFEELNKELGNSFSLTDLKN